jgi:hypothetical protein
MEAFDYGILQGEKAPLPGALAAFTAEQIATLPHLAASDYSANGYTNGACAAIGILPTDFRSFEDYQQGRPIDPYPVDVNPRPTQSPGTPTSGSWTPRSFPGIARGRKSCFRPLL